MRILSALPLLAACAADPTTSGPPVPVGYTPLIETSWTVAPGEERYLCTRQTVTEEMWIRALRPVSPPGTHHLVLMTGAPDGPDGTVECNSSLPKPAIYASGVGTQPLELPEDVAVHLEPGDQLLLNVHLYNAGEEPLEHVSAIEIEHTSPVEPSHEAGVVLAGKGQGLVVPPGMSTQRGTCTTPGDMTLFALAPHMHTRGTHMTVMYQSAQLFDDDYDFDQQRFHVLPEAVQTVEGAKLTVDCTYFNETSAPLYFGESTEEEMCYALAFVYPKPASDSCVR